MCCFSLPAARDCSNGFFFVAIFFIVLCVNDRFSDISNVTTNRSSTLNIALRTGANLQLYSNKASLIRDLIHRFANEAEKVIVKRFLSLSCIDSVSLAYYKAVSYN